MAGTRPAAAPARRDTNQLSFRNWAPDLVGLGPSGKLSLSLYRIARVPEMRRRLPRQPGSRVAKAAEVARRARRTGTTSVDQRQQFRCLLVKCAFSGSGCFLRIRLTGLQPEADTSPMPLTWRDILGKSLSHAYSQVGA